ncbi:MAG: hypothetical protein Q4A11_07390, partial [Brachymonas sp.]|nr:hypothetical protein [Brachymonas sp.]
MLRLLRQLCAFCVFYLLWKPALGSHACALGASLAHQTKRIFHVSCVLHLAGIHAAIVAVLGCEGKFLPCYPIARQWRVKVAMCAATSSGCV